jgi:hypothetical protein
MSDNPNPQDIIIAKLLPFLINPKLSMQLYRILGKEFCCYGHFKKLQNIKGYSDYRTLIQCFAVFKEINRWNYVSDPKTETMQPQANR